MATITRLAGYEYSSMWQEKDNGEIIALRGFNIGGNRIIEKDFSRISNELSLKLKRSRLYKNDVIYPCVGTIGNAVVIEDDNKYHIQQNIAKITPNKNEVDSYYLAHYLISHLGLNEIAKFNGSSSQPNILVGSLRQYSIALPPTKIEQNAIATILSDTEALIEHLEKLIAKKIAIKQGAMQQLLIGEKRLPGFSGEWKVKKLAGILQSVKLGGNYPNSEKETNYPLIKMGNINRGFIDLSKIEFITTGYIPSENDKLEYGDILFNTRNTLELVGKVSIWKNELLLAYYNSNLMRLQFKKSEVYSNFFMNYILNTKQSLSQLKGFATGTTSVAAIYTRDLLKLEVQLPPLPEQQAIAQILSDMDTEIEALEQKRDKYTMLKQGMMQELLTGKTRLV